jgi:hypothetical protein
LLTYRIDSTSRTRIRRPLVLFHGLAVELALDENVGLRVGQVRAKTRENVNPEHEPVRLFRISALSLTATDGVAGGIYARVDLVPGAAINHSALL